MRALAGHGCHSWKYQTDSCCSGSAQAPDEWQKPLKVCECICVRDAFVRQSEAFPKGPTALCAPKGWAGKWKYPMYVIDRAWHPYISLCWMLIGNIYVPPPESKSSEIEPLKQNASARLCSRTIQRLECTIKSLTIGTNVTRHLSRCEKNNSEYTAYMNICS